MEYEQLDIFHYLQLKEEIKENLSERYCWDDDVNEIHAMLISLAKENGISISEDEFSIWSHVPQYGYRLWLEMEVTRENLKNINFQNGIQEIAEKAKQRKVELSCMIGACYFYSGEYTASLPFSTTFMDKARQRIKTKDLL